MILEEFIKWQQMQSEDTEFKRFSESYINARQLQDVLAYIMYQVYMNQCCLEGLIEDMEFTYEEKPQKKKSKKSNGRVERRKAT